jgi:fructose-1,6-bisphosphatase II
MSESGHPRARATAFERALIPDTIRMTEHAAIAASRVAGMGDEPLVDQAGTEAMRTVLNDLNIDGRIVIGEGERDEAPMLFHGERVGRGEPGGREVDIAVDPVEGTGITAKMVNGAVAVIALAERGGLLNAPDVYMDKLIVGPPAAGKVTLGAPAQQNLKAVADSLGRNVGDLTVAILDRDRHDGLVAEVRATGARVKLIGDGDVIAAISAAVKGTNVHAVMGTGGAPEGVLAAAALKCLGGEIQGRFMARNQAEHDRLNAAGVDLSATYTTDRLAPAAHLVFAATGITDGDLLKGVKFFGGGARTHTVSMGLASRVIRFSDGVHLLGDGARVHVQV